MAFAPRRFRPNQFGLADRDIRNVANELGRIEGGFEQAFGPSQFSFVVPELQRAIEAEQAGMSPQEEAIARSQIRNQFNAATGNLASQGARAGAFQPTDVQGAAAGRPARSLAQGLLGLQAQKAQLRRAGSQAAAGQLTSLANIPAQAERAGREAYGTEISRLRRPQNFFGFGGRRPSGLGPNIHRPIRRNPGF